MALFYHLHTQLDLENKSLDDLTPQEIIRFEKKLKAEVKLGENIDLNEVEKLIFILKNHLPEIKELYHSNYRVLRQILLAEKGFVIPESTVHATFYPSTELLSFIDFYFSETLNNYAARCLQDDHYNALLYLLTYRELLSADIRHGISEKLKQKIEYISECIRINPSSIGDKIVPAFNPKFYQCLNALGPILFENNIIDLYNESVNKLQRTNRNYFFSLLYALGFYQPIRSDLVKLFSDNQKMAYSNGARERKYIKSEKNQKGGTYINPSSGAGSSGDSSWGLKGFGAVVAIILIILKIALFSSRNSNNKYEWNNPTITGTYALEDEMVTYKDSIAYDMNYTFTQLCCEEIEVIESEPAEFTDEGSIYKSIDEFNVSNMSVEICNKTEQNMMLIFASKKALYLKPYDSKKISLHNNNFVVYTGKNFQQLTYVDAYGSIVYEQVFSEMTDDEKTILGRVYSLKNFRGTDGYRMDIGIADSTVEFNITKTFQLGNFKYD